MRNVVFVDRDGVINVDTGYVHRSEDFRFMDGVFDAFRTLQDHGYALVVVTNQSAIGRAYCSEGDFLVLSRWMSDRFAEQGISITGIYHCPHLPDDGCNCRKPAPGMFLQAAADHDVDLARSWMIGDRDTDIEAARRAGVGRSILLSDAVDSPTAPARATYVCPSIQRAAKTISTTRNHHCEPTVS